jgi:hypothetical protein
MQSLARVRKVGKWGGVVVTAMLVAAWVVSRWQGARVVVGSEVIVTLHAGEARATTMGPMSPRMSFGRVDPPHWEWSFFGKTWGGDFTYEAPLWAPIVMLGAATCVLWWWDTRASGRMQGRCAACGYDRAGLGAGAVCPECGRGTL